MIRAVLAGGLMVLAGAATAATTPTGDGVAAAAAALAAERVPYVTGNLGGPQGPEEAGLPASGLDCMTFVEAALMRAKSLQSPAQQRDWLQRTRYDGAAPSYCTRAHYLSDWAERNARQGWIEEVTQAIASQTGTSLQQHRWTRRWMSSHALDPQDCIDTGEAPAPADFIAPADYGNIEAAVQPGDLLVFVARDAGLDSVHVAVAQPGGGLAMASSISGRSLLLPSWVAYARSRPKFLGVRVLRVREVPPVALSPAADPSAGHADAARAP